MQPIQIQKTFPSPIQTVWQAITNPAETKQWYFDFADDFKLQPGAVFEWNGTDEKGKQWLHRGKMIEIIPNEKLVHSWEYPGYSGNSTITWQLTKIDEGNTLVQLTHEFTIPFDRNVPELKRENFEKGWDYIINISLQQYLSSNKP